jgi:PAN domain.
MSLPAIIIIIVISFAQTIEVSANIQWGNATKKYINVNGGVLEVLSAPYKKFTGRTLVELPSLWGGVVSTELQCINRCSETSGCVSAVYRAGDGGCYAYNVTCSQVDYHCYKKKEGYVMFEIKVNLKKKIYILLLPQFCTKTDGITALRAR